MQTLLFGFLLSLLAIHAVHGGDIVLIKIELTLPENCVSGKMLVEEQTKGYVKVSQLAEGDFIRGINGADRSQAWCEVEAVFPVPHSENQTTYDGFTANHFVVDQTVHPQEKKGVVNRGPVFTLATKCDAAVNAGNQAFAPFSATFCPRELSWSEYLHIIGAVRRVTTQTGNFWYDLSVYQDNDNAKVTHWADHLPNLCNEMLRCAKVGQCQAFENAVRDFVYDHLKEEYREIVNRVFPKMGADVNKEQTGTVSEVVRSQGASRNVLISVGCSTVAVVLIVGLAFLVYRRQKKRSNEREPLLIPRNGFGSAVDVKA